MSVLKLKLLCREPVQPDQSETIEINRSDEQEREQERGQTARITSVRFQNEAFTYALSPVV